MIHGKLILHPRDPAAAPDRDRLIAALTDAGLLGAPFLFEGRRHFLPGPELMHLVIFLGCSPAISFTPPAGGESRDGPDFCHIELPAVTAAPELLGGAGVKTPRCRNCRLPAEGWRALAAQWRDDPEGFRYRCPGCGTETPLHRLDWRRSAGFGRASVAVWGVFEGEAVPDDHLLTALRQVSGGEWEYFYGSTGGEEPAG